MTLPAGGPNIDYMSLGYGAVTVYGVCRERYSKEAMDALESDLLLIDLQETDPEAAQAELNRRAAAD